MSLRLTAPSILDLEARHGSVTRGLRNAMRAHGGRPFGHGTGGGAFVALATGMGQLVDALAARLPAGAIRTGVRVESVREVASRQFAVDGEDGERFDATSVVFACPAFETGRILGTESRLAYASCAVVHLAYRRQQLRAPLTAFGFFVPRGARTRLLACSFVSEKFPARAPDGVVLLRAFLGGARYPHLLDDDDAALAAEAHVALAPVLGIAGGPAMTRVHRHPRAMPQYETGEAPALARAVAAIEGRAGLFVTGGGAGAVGIADCVRLAEATADRVAGRRPATATEIRTAGTR
jgi:oxygen-dependent protoporphyrinogen oxidase